MKTKCAKERESKRKRGKPFPLRFFKLKISKILFLKSAPPYQTERTRDSAAQLITHASHTLSKYHHQIICIILYVSAVYVHKIKNVLSRVKTIFSLNFAQTQPNL